MTGSHPCNYCTKEISNNHRLAFHMIALLRLVVMAFQSSMISVEDYPQGMYFIERLKLQDQQHTFFSYRHVYVHVHVHVHTLALSSKPVFLQQQLSICRCKRGIHAHIAFFWTQQPSFHRANCQGGKIFVVENWFQPLKFNPTKCFTHENVCVCGIMHLLNSLQLNNTTSKHSILSTGRRTICSVLLTVNCIGTVCYEPCLCIVPAHSHGLD